MDAQKMGNFIARRRKELGLTQAGLAEKIQVTDKAVSRWERGVGLPDINMLEPLAQVLEVSLVELVQAECTGQENISLCDAEQIVADTIRLSQSRRISRVVGSGILGVFGGICVFLLWLLIRDGSILTYSVGSLVTGLVAWAAPVWQMTMARSSKAAVPGLVSLGAALTSVTVQFFDLAQEVDTGDFAAIEDTIHALCMVVVLFGAVTLLLNIWMVRKASCKN